MLKPLTWTQLRIHKARFLHIDYLLGQYSPSLIASFYREFLAGAVFLVHTNAAGKVDAFVMGGDAGMLSCRKRQFAKKHAARFACETLLRPRLWRIAARTAWGLLTPASDHASKEAATPFAKNMRLLSIAVAGEAEGTGAATALIREFDAKLRQSCGGYELTVLKTNERARRFYEKLDFLFIRETAQEYVFQKTLHD